MTRYMLIGFTLAAAVEAAQAEGFTIKGDAAKGAPTYKMFCATCHGDTGAGDGPASAALNPKPRNFTDKSIKEKMTDEEIFKAIKDGGPAVGKSPLMIAWGPVLGDDQKIHDVAAFVRSLAK